MLHGGVEFEKQEEVLNEISLSRFLEQVDRKIWRVHLQSMYASLYHDLFISDGKGEKQMQPGQEVPKGNRLLYGKHCPYPFCDLLLLQPPLGLRSNANCNSVPLIIC
jgi:hypothetical protein